MKKKSNEIDWRVMIAAIAALLIIECFAIAYGHNGLLRSTIVAVIALMGGVTLPQLKIK